MQLSSHDIRMKEFRHAILRGYSEEDVDTFLMHLAVDMDRRERHDSSSPGQPNNDRETNPPAVPDPAADTERIAEQAAADTISEAQEQARALYLAAKQAAHDLEHQTKLANTNIISEARASAERGLTKARQRAEEILSEAREHEQRASRAEAEAELRLAYVEKRLAKKALVLAEEAKRLGALAEWLAQQDLMPDSDDEFGIEQGHRPAHAAPSAGEVLPLRRTAE
jgi:DivIVA domain-containing protein